MEKVDDLDYQDSIKNRKTLHNVFGDFNYEVQTNHPHQLVSLSFYKSIRSISFTIDELEQLKAVMEEKVNELKRWKKGEQDAG